MSNKQSTESEESDAQILARHRELRLLKKETEKLNAITRKMDDGIALTKAEIKWYKTHFPATHYVKGSAYDLYIMHPTSKRTEAARAKARQRAKVRALRANE